MEMKNVGVGGLCDTEGRGKATFQGRVGSVRGMCGAGPLRARAWMPCQRRSSGMRTERNGKYAGGDVLRNKAVTTENSEHTCRVLDCARARTSSTDVAILDIFLSTAIPSMLFLPTSNSLLPFWPAVFDQKNNVNPIIAGCAQRTQVLTSKCSSLRKDGVDGRSSN